MADTRRKIVVDLEFYNDLKKIAAKEKRKLLPQLKLILSAYREIVPRQYDIEKRVVRLEKATKIKS